MLTQMQRRIQKQAMIFLILSAFLLSISTPISIALDNIAIGVGLIGLIVIYKQLKIEDTDYRILGVSAIGLVSSLASISPLLSLKKSHYLWHFLPYFITSRIKREKISTLLIVLGAFGIVAVLAVIFQAFTGIKPTHLKSLSLIHILENPIRAEGFFSSPLTTSAIVCVLFFIFASIFVFFDNKKWRIYSFFVSVFMLAGLIFTLTRSYWIGSFVALIFLPFIYLKSNRAKLVPVLAVLIAALMYVFSPLIHNRVETIIHYKKNVPAMDRVALWEAGLQMYKDYNIRYKLIGCGSGNVYRFLKPYLVEKVKKIFGDKNVNSHLFSSVHNEYLQILLKWGIIGLSVWLYLWIYVLFKNITFIAKTGNGFYRALIVGITMGFIAFLVGGFFEHNVGDAEVIIFIMFILGINKNILDSLKEGVL